MPGIMNPKVLLNKSSHMLLHPKTPEGERIIAEWGDLWYIHRRQCKRKVKWSPLLNWYRISPDHIRNSRHKMCVWIHPRTNTDFNVEFIND